MSKKDGIVWKGSILVLILGLDLMSTEEDQETIFPHEVKVASKSMLGEPTYSKDDGILTLNSL